MGDVLVEDAGAANSSPGGEAQMLFYAKLAKLEDDVLAGKNPRIKLSGNLVERFSTWSSLPRSRAQAKDALTRHVELSPELCSNDQRHFIEVTEAESLSSFASMNVRNNGVAHSEPIAAAKIEQLRIAEIRLERQRIEYSLKTSIEKRQPAPTSERGDAWESFDVRQIFDVSRLLDEVKLVIPHYSGVSEEASIRGSPESSPFEDGYYSSKANSPWSSETPRRDADVSPAYAGSDLLELESEPMDIDDQGFLANDEDDDDDDEGEMDIDEGDSMEESHSNASKTSGDPYSPEPYLSQKNHSASPSHRINQLKPEAQLGREESYSPPSAASMPTETGTSKELLPLQALTQIATSLDEDRHGLRGRSMDYEDQLADRARADRSESYSPPSPELTITGAARSHPKMISNWTNAKDSVFHPLNQAERASSHQMNPSHQLPVVPHQVLTMDQIQNLARHSAQEGIGNSHWAQTTTESRPVYSGQQSQAHNVNSISNKKKSKKGKRTKQSNQRISVTVPDSPKHRPRTKRATMDDFPLSQSFPPTKRLAGDKSSLEPYIKPEPLSPPGFGAVDTEGSGGRRRVVQYADGRVEIEPYHALSELPKVRHTLESDNAPDDLVPILGSSIHNGSRPIRSLSRVGSQAEGLMLSPLSDSTLLQSHRRDRGDLRRVASLQYASRPQSPPRERYWPEDAEYSRAARAATVREGPYVMEPSRRGSPHLAFEHSAASRRFTHENFEAPDVYGRQAAHPPRQKIIIDEDGNEYIAVLRNEAPRTPAPVLQEFNYDGTRLARENFIPYKAPFARSKSVYERSRSSRPPPRVIELSDDEDYQLMPPPRFPPNPRVMQADYIHPPGKRVSDYQPRNVIRAASLQPPFHTGHVPIPPYNEMIGMDLEDPRRVETATGESRPIPKPTWLSQASGASQLRGRASSALPNTSGYHDRYGTGEYDPTKVRYSRF